MKQNGNTILITGGSSGIGFETARHLVNNGNTVIICGRSMEKLIAAKALIPSLEIIRCDISIKSECEKLFKEIKQSFPHCNILINNAAIVHRTGFTTDENIISKGELEMQTNYFGPVTLTRLFLPFLEKNKDPQIIYLTTGLVYAPKAAYPFYCSTKAALHSFIQTLRYQIKDYNVKITEVLMTVVDTPFHEGNTPKSAVTAEKAVKEMMKELKNGKSEIRIGVVKLLYNISRFAPSLAFRMINSV